MKASSVCIPRSQCMVSINVQSFILILLGIFTAASIAGAESAVPPHRDNKLALQLNLLGRGYDERFEYSHSEQRNWSLNSRQQLAGLWHFNNPSVQIAGQLQLTSNATDYSNHHRNHDGNLASDFYDFRSGGSRLRGNIAGSLAFKYYPGHSLFAVVADGSLNREKGTDWWSFLARNQWSGRWSRQRSRAANWWHYNESTVGLGFGIGRVREVPDLTLTSLAEALLGSESRPVNDVIDAIAFQPVWRQPRQDGFFAALRFGSVTARDREHASGSTVSQSFDSAYGYTSQAMDYLSGGWGWTDQITAGPQAEYHHPFGRNFQLDIWGKSEWDLEYIGDDPLYEASVRVESRLSPHFRLELWGYQRRWNGTDWNQWFHTRLGCDVNRVCETHMALTYGYYPHYDTMRSLRVELGLTVWLFGQIDPSQVVFPSVTPNWIVDPN